MKTNRPTKIITHHSAYGAGHTVEDVDRWHKDRWAGFASNVHKNANGEFYHVGYHFVIEKDGTVTQTRAISEEGAHCLGQNTTSLGVCFLGNFDVQYPTAPQTKAWKKWYKEYGNGLPVYPHRMYSNTNCHGKLLADDYWSLWVKREMMMSQIEKLRALISRLQVLITKRTMK
jgi:hypothetical protein